MFDECLEYEMEDTYFDMKELLYETLGSFVSTCIKMDMEKEECIEEMESAIKDVTTSYFG